MEFRELKKNEANDLMQRWILNENIPGLDDEELAMREYLVNAYKEIRSKHMKNLYMIDLDFGMILFKYFNSQSSFTMRTAANDGVWRYLSLVIVPDLVSDRWGKSNESHFWSMGNRIWLKQIWWFIYLSLQLDDGERHFDLNKTYSVLSNTGFTTDEILNLVERTGKKGTYVDVYREIIRRYSQIPSSIRQRYKVKNSRISLFRRIMILHTAKSVAIDPYLFGVKEYVNAIFSDLEVEG